MKTAVALAPRVPPMAERDILAIVVALQADVRDLTRRVEQGERAQAHAGAAVGETAGRRRMSLDEAGRRGVLPRCPRTVRNWLATPESRAMWKTDLFVRRIANRLEVDLDGLEEWRRQMAAPAAPIWPKRWGTRGPQ